MFDEQISTIATDSASVQSGGEISPVSDRLKAIAQITVMHPDFKQAFDAMERGMKSFGRTGEPVCVLLLGGSGCGKSHLADRFEQLYPRSTKNGQAHIPVLRIRVPSDPKIKSCASTMLARLGDPLYARGTEAEMTKRIQHHLKKSETQFVIMEEFQHFVDAESEKLFLSAANWLKILIEETRVPFAVEGLQRTKKLFDADDQLSGRFDGPYYLLPFRWFQPGNPPTVASKPFRGFLKGIHRAMPFKDCVDFSERSVALRFFCSSQGSPRRVGKLIAQAAMIAEEKGSETIGLDTFAQAYVQRCGYQVSKERNPFSKEFDLDDAESELEKGARRSQKDAGEGVFER